MSNKLRDIVYEIQYKLDFTLEQVAEKVGYSGPYISRAMAKGVEGKLLATLKYAMKRILPILFLSVLLFGCKKEPVYYSYEVTGTSGNYFVTIENASGDTEQYSEVGNGWRYTWTQTGARWLYVSAQNNLNSGTVIVKIIRDGAVVKQAVSQGGYVIATASGEF